MAPPSGGTTSVQVAVRIRPTTSQDTVSIPARFQRTVIQAASATSVQVDSTQSAPTAIATNGGTQAPPSSAGPTKKQSYTFDQVHPPSTSQHALFQATAEPLIARFLQGFNCTILAYGQTSSGKTYSMTGVDLDADPSDPHNGMGIIPRAVSGIFQRAKQIKEERAGGWSCSIKGSFIEIYNEDLIDLLGESVKREVQIREDKDGHIIWGGLREIAVRNAGEVMNLLRQGTSIRRTNETDMNAQSSRSHAIFSLTLTQKKYTGSGPPPRSSSPLPPTGRSPSRLARPGSVYASATGPRVSSPTFGRPPTPSFHTAIGRGGGLRPGSAMGGRISPAPGKDEDDVGEWVTIVSKFHFVDLAGSERLKRTAAAGERIKEGISINSGLLALGNVISALGDPARAKSHTASHVPYRDSKLTRLLQDSLGGNAHTLMIACVSPAEWNVGETVNTLKYANRARNIRNRAVVNEKEDGWDDVEWLQNMVTRLRKELKGIKDGSSSGDALLTIGHDHELDGTNRLVMQQFVDLQSQHDELRQQFTQRTQELTRLRRELGESQRASGGSIPGTGKYEEIVGPVIEEYEKTIAAMEAELSLNRVALRHTNDLVTEKEEELSLVTERHSATELYLEELRTRVVKLTDREASTEAYIRDLEDKIKSYDETNISSSSSVSDLKREIQQCKDAELHSTQYIADLEQRLARSDESVLSLRECVQRLEHEVETRVQAAELLQRRLNELTADEHGWRSDLELRESKLKEMERQLEAWEEKRRLVGEERERLGDVAGDVAKARRSLEVDMRSAANPPSDGEHGLSSEDQLTSLQQTHQATLSDLAAVTDKYRDALREISDLAAQIQEAKLQSVATLESSEEISEPPLPPTPRRRLTIGSNNTLRSPRSSETVQTNGNGRRLFFRQAASTESLHGRSLSQSQSLSQELSSARLHRPSVTGRPDSLAIPSPTLLSPPLPRPNLSLQVPGAESPGGERSAASLEKEIMRLQEVLKEREAEISSLEQSLKERPPKPTAVVQEISEAEDDNEIADSNLKDLSPKTLKQFKTLRRLSRRLSLQKATEPPEDTSETLDRLNELMLSMAQKESHHREVVDSLNSELSQIRRQHDELSALSRDQALNMSTELEALRKEHINTVSELENLQLGHAQTSIELADQRVSQANLKTVIEELRGRELTMLAKLHSAEENHAAEVEHMRAQHEQAIKEKGTKLDLILIEVRQAHESELVKLRADVADAAAALAQSQRQHEEAFGKLRADHALELEKRGQEVEAFLGQSQSEQADSLSRIQGEHAQALKKEIEQAHSRVQEIRDQHTSAMEKLRSEHEETLLQKQAESVKVLDRVQQEHAAELTRMELARDTILTESQSKHAAATQSLQEDYDLTISTKEQAYQEALGRLKLDHDQICVGLERTHAMFLEQANSEHNSALRQLKEEMGARIIQLEQDIKRAQEEAAASISHHDYEVETAVQSTKQQHAATLREVEKEHENALHTLKMEHEASLAQFKAAQEDDKSAMVRAHIEEISKIRSEYQAALSEANATLVSSKKQQEVILEDSRRQHEALLTQITEEHTTSLKELETTRAQERETLLKDHELLVQEVAAYKSAMDEFTVTREQTREAHEEIIVEKDILIASLEEELSTTKEQRTQFAATVESLRAELENTRTKTTELVKEASKRESLVHDLERHRSLLGEVQINLQNTRDERDTLAAEKNRQEDILRQLQAQLEVQPLSKASESTAGAPRPLIEHRTGSLPRPNGLPPAKAPPMTPPPSGPPPPTPAHLPRLANDTGASRSSATISTSSRTSQMDSSLASTPATSTIANGHAQAGMKVEEQARQLEEKETMIKTLNKQLTHCEGDLQAHMDLVSTLETQLNDSERNLRKARMQATEISKERDRLNGQVESLRNELQEAKREVVTVRRSVVEEKQSLEHRLDEERKAKERARAQLDTRMEELQKRKSKFACM
ncbi:kinesin [Ramaria rubella]|nr:kinesin [Ramaria rubella]